MLLMKRILKKLNRLLSKVDTELVRKSSLDKIRSEIYPFLPLQQKRRLSYFFKERSQKERSPNPLFLESNVISCTNQQNTRLKNLRKLYGLYSSPATAHSAWGDGRAAKVALTSFRGDSPYVWQGRDEFEINYLMTAYYVKVHDRLRLFEKMDEDPLFGVRTYELENGKLVSRDYLDSILEINFLAKHLSPSFFSNASVLDIGAGYGRFAHRLVKAFPEINQIVCTDAIPESTFLCEYYLNFRGVADKAITIPLPDFSSYVKNTSVHLATNMHSFSECPLKTICWWLDLVMEAQAEYLFIVPNGSSDRSNRVPPLLSREKNGSSLDFELEILSRGYMLHAKELKYADPSLNNYGIAPTGYYLFKRTSRKYVS